MLRAQKTTTTKFFLIIATDNFQEISHSHKPIESLTNMGKFPLLILSITILPKGDIK